MNVLIAIPFMNGTDFLQRAIDGLKDSNYTILLVNDGSSLNESESARNICKNSSKIHMVTNTVNIGYVHTINRIIGEAIRRNIDFLILANSDTIFTDTDVEALLDLIQRPNVVAVGGKIVDYDTGTKIIHTGTRLENGEIVDPYIGRDFQDPIVNDIERRLWVNGCAVAYDMGIFRHYGFKFDTAFSPAYFEESDLMTMFNLMGLTVLYQPKAEIRHFVKATMGKDPKSPKIFWDNWNKYLARWAPFFSSKQLQF